MDIVYSSDNNYLKYVEVSIISLLENNSESTVNIHLLCLDIKKNKKAIIQTLVSRYKKAQILFYDIKESDFEQYKNVSTYPGITLPAYFRLHLSRILPDVDKVLYLDGNTVINNSLNNLFNYDISDYYLAGVPDINCRQFESVHKKYNLKDGSYINSGVVLFNLKKIRTESCDVRIDAFVEDNFNDVLFGDQDILNLFYANNIFVLPDIYNAHGENYFSRNTYKRPVIIHHVCKAWNMGTKTYYQHKYFKYLRLTSGAFPSRFKEYYWRIKNNLLAFFKLLSNPKRTFSYEFLYEVYKCTLRRIIKR